MYLLSAFGRGWWFSNSQQFSQNTLQEYFTPTINANHVFTVLCTSGMSWTPHGVKSKVIQNQPLISGLYSLLALPPASPLFKSMMVCFEQWQPFLKILFLFSTSSCLLQRCLTQSQSRDIRWCSQPGPDEQQYTGNYSRSVVLLLMHFCHTTSVYGLWFCLPEGTDSSAQGINCVGVKVLQNQMCKYILWITYMAAGTISDRRSELCMILWWFKGGM